MTGIASRTMPAGWFVVVRKAETTFEALGARVRLALAGGDRGLAQRLGLGLEVEGLSRFWIAAAPMPPSEK